MTSVPARRNPPAVQAVPTYTVNEAEAEAAFEAVCAVSGAMKAKPELRQNPYYMALLDTAYARFQARFELLK